MVAAASETLPAAHCVQAAEPEPVLKVPGLHAMHSWYVPENPAVHEHSEMSSLPNAGVAEFSGQGLQRVLLIIVYEPAAHLHIDACTLISVKYIFPKFSRCSCAFL